MAHLPVPNAAAIAVAPPQLPANLVAGLPLQGAIPTFNQVEAVDEALYAVKASKNTQGVAVPTSTVDHVNMLTYHHAVLQSGAFPPRRG